MFSIKFLLTSDKSEDIFMFLTLNFPRLVTSTKLYIRKLVLLAGKVILIHMQMYSRPKNTKLIRNFLVQGSQQKFS